MIYYLAARAIPYINLLPGGKGNTISYLFYLEISAIPYLTIFLAKRAKPYLTIVPGDKANTIHNYFT